MMQADKEDSMNKPDWLWFIIGIISGVILCLIF